MDTVLLAIADMEGRLQGKRLTGTHFVEDVLEHGAEGCNYLLAVDVDMETVEGYEMSSWERGYGDFEMVPDLDTLRPIPWHPATVLVMADLQWHGGDPVVASPRQILGRQLDRLAERGWKAMAGTELEFMLFKDTYEDAWKSGYRDLHPANLYNVDYSLLGTARVEPLIRRIRNEMAGAGMKVENSKGECNFGQHEINFHYGEALRACDEHAIYKNGVKEIASQEEMAITFMAKFNELEGNSCHIHCSLASEDGANVFGEDRPTFERFVAGQLAAMRELTHVLRAADQLVQALRRGLVRAHRGGLGRGQPHVRHPRRRPRAVAAVREPPARCGREPLPGAGGHDRRRPARASTRRWSWSPRWRATPTPPTASGCPAACATPVSSSPVRTLAREAFGQEVVDHYLNHADVELKAFDAAVTDWEKVRGFERL